jgi:hypothetical protein
MALRRSHGLLLTTQATRRRGNDDRLDGSPVDRPIPALTIEIVAPAPVPEAPANVAPLARTRARARETAGADGVREQQFLVSCLSTLVVPPCFTVGSTADRWL